MESYRSDEIVCAAQETCLTPAAAGAWLGHPASSVGTTTETGEVRGGIRLALSHLGHCSSPLFSRSV